MPKKSLKGLKTLLNQKFKNLREYQQKRKNNDGEKELFSGLNLLIDESSETRKFIEKYNPNDLYKALIFGVLLVFLLLFGIDLLVTRKLADVREELVDAKEGVLVYKDVEESARNVIDNMEFYKETLQYKTNFSEKLEIAYDLIGDMDHDNFTISKESFSFQATTGGLLEVANLIGEYLETGKIDHIVLQSASLDIQRRQVTFSIKGVFK